MYYKHVFNTLSLYHHWDWYCLMLIWSILHDAQIELILHCSTGAHTMLMILWYFNGLLLFKRYLNGCYYLYWYNMIFLWYVMIQKYFYGLCNCTKLLYIICFKTSERYCSDLDDMSQVSFMCSSNTGGVLTWNLGSSKLSCTFLARTLVCDALWICVSQATKVIWTFVMSFSVTS